MQGEFDTQADMLNMPLIVQNSKLTLGDIATINRKIKDDSPRRYGEYQKTGLVYVAMVFNKAPGSNILSSADGAKALIEAELHKQKYAGVTHVYTLDNADNIRYDYSTVFGNGLQTVFLVFVAMLIYVGFRESFIAAVSIPVAFMITFIILNRMGLSLNFLTNFSLIIAFGMTIDTTIVILEGAYENMKLGYNPKSAVLLSVKDYKLPLITGSLTNIVVFFPMLALPGVIGKYLAYIPITIFLTLLAGLFISLTFTPAIYYKLASKRMEYEHNEDIEEFLPEDEMALLTEERKGKKLIHVTEDRREKILNRFDTKYSMLLARVMKSPKARFWIVFGSILAVFIGGATLNPGFFLFPASDNNLVMVSLEAKQGTDKDKVFTYASGLDAVFSSIPEVKDYFYSVNKNIINVTVDLQRKELRTSLGQRDVFAVEKEIDSRMTPRQQQGLKVTSQVAAGGPPTGSPVGIKLIAASNKDLPTLVKVSKDFQKYLSSLTGTKNVANSSDDSPGQFVFTLSRSALWVLGLMPSDVVGELYARVNSLGAGSFKDDYDDQDVVVQYADTVNQVSPDNILSIVLSTKVGPVPVGQIASYAFDSAISTISREDTKITITVNSDLQDGLSPDAIQPKLEAFAATYHFPDGVTYEAGGETAGNQDLIISTLVAFVIAVLLIYGILVLLFNSFLQPAIIMTSILMGYLGSLFGIELLGLPYSMPFAIGFIALTGIVVNNAIVLIDRVNINLSRGMQMYDAIVEAGKSRLNPIVLTTLVNIVDLFSIVGQDSFYASLGYTIMRGLTIASVTTLFVVPALYFDQEVLRKLIKRAFFSPILFAGLGGFLWLGLVIAAAGLGFNIFTADWFGTFTIGVFVLYVAGYMIYQHIARRKNGQTIIQSRLGYRLVSANNKPLPRHKIIQRQWLVIAHFAPIGIFGFFGMPGWGVLITLAWLCVDLYFARFDPEQRVLHDKLIGTKILYDKPEEEEPDPMFGV